MMNGAHTQYNLKRICFNREARSLFVNGKYHCTEVDQFKESVLGKRSLAPTVDLA